MTTYTTKSKACKAAERLAVKHGKAYIYITLIVSGLKAGDYTVTPDRISPQSERIECYITGTAIQPGTDGMLVKAGSIL